MVEPVGLVHGSEQLKPVKSQNYPYAFPPSDGAKAVTLGL